MAGNGEDVGFRDVRLHRHVGGDVVVPEALFWLSGDSEGRPWTGSCVASIASNKEGRALSCTGWTLASRPSDSGHPLHRGSGHGVSGTWIPSIEAGGVSVAYFRHGYRLRRSGNR